MSRTTRPAALLALAATAFAPAAGAEATEFCVNCTGPDASYACETQGGQGWLRCITEIAREGLHDSCSVDRKAVPPCPGQRRVLPALDGPTPEPPPIQAAIPEPSAENGPPPAAAHDPSADPGATGQPPKKRVPQTMQELAGDTIEASKEGLKKAGETVSDTAKKAGTAVTDTAKSAGDGLSKAGDAVGSAAKKTWNCLTSLFSDC